MDIDSPAPNPPKTHAVPKDATRELTITGSYLRLPIKNAAPVWKLTLTADGKEEPPIAIGLASGKPDWWGWKDVRSLMGKTVTLKLMGASQGAADLVAITQADSIETPSDLYHEALRPQFHFSSRRGWLNDPNGLSFYKGEYHLFYQHNPYGVPWGNMHWGHAVSRDLVHWHELSDALYPDEMGQMWSGSAVVDGRNTSGLGQKGQAPLVLIYTADKTWGICLASTLDGRRITKYADNPVIKQITKENRDPKVMWYEPEKKWVMVLFVPYPVEGLDAKEKSAKKNTIVFLSSPNLKDWTVMSQVPFSKECPDFFELPVDGDKAHQKWVLTSANGDYKVGGFDGTAFTPETPMLPGPSGGKSYAAQTFGNMPQGDHRRIHIGWLQVPSPGMPFSQEMSVPIELKLIATPEGPRLTWTPVEELKALRGEGHHIKSLTLKPGDTNPLANVHGNLLEIRARFKPNEAGEMSLNVRGASVNYNAATQE
ncbi:MAG TPA: glycoside hydrolase family 32 protein, partial [Candidatus Methylacidiphilales bacterium]